MRPGLLAPATLAVGGLLISGLPSGLRRALWAVSVFAVASAVFYVAPPIRYGHRPPGELFVCLNMGLIMVAASVTLLLNRFAPRSLALPVGLMVAGVLYYQSLPEIETDLAAGKHTLANTLGKGRAGLLFRLRWPWVWFCCSTSGPPVWLARAFGPVGPALLSGGLPPHQPRRKGRLAAPGRSRPSGAQGLFDQRRGLDSGRPALSSTLIKSPRRTLGAHCPGRHFLSPNALEMPELSKYSGPAPDSQPSALPPLTRKRGRHIFCSILGQNGSGKSCRMEEHS